MIFDKLVSNSVHLNREDYIQIVSPELKKIFVATSNK